MFPWAGPLYHLASLSPQDSMQHQHRLKHPASRSALILDIEGNVPFVCLPGLEDLAFFKSAKTRLWSSPNEIANATG